VVVSRDGIESQDSLHAIEQAGGASSLGLGTFSRGKTGAVSGVDWRHPTRNSVRGSGNADGNFFVEFVFYECEYETQYDERYDGQAGDIGGPAATRELSAGSFCYFHDAVDVGISFLLFVDAIYGGICGDDACGACKTGAGLRDSPQSSQRAQRRKSVVDR